MRLPCLSRRRRAGRLDRGCPYIYNSCPAAVWPNNQSGLCLIAKDPARFGFSIPPQTPVEYEEVVLTRPLHLRTAAQAVGVSYEELKALNPELRKDLTPPDPAYHLKVPVGRKTAFLSNLATYQDWKRIHAVRHQVRRGETLARLASRYGTTVPAILEANALSKSERPNPGDWLLIPKPSKPADGTPRPLIKASR